MTQRRRSWSLGVGGVLGLFRLRFGSRRVVLLDLFAVAGIAIGVGLLFASQVASTSLSGSVRALSSQVVGRAQYQLMARGPNGVSEDLLLDARRVRGVRVALPILEYPAAVIGPSGRRRAVDLVGVDPRFEHFSSPSLKRFKPSTLAKFETIALPEPVAAGIGAGPLETVSVQVGARIIPTLFGTVLARRDIGSLVNSPVLIAPILYAQQLTGMKNRVTRVFVQANPGHEHEVLQGLREQARVWNVNLEPASFDARLFAVAESPENQSETLFSVISAIVGFMLALCAILITVPRRRRVLAILQLESANSKMLLQSLSFDAVVLSVLACSIGLVLGDIVSVAVLHSTPGYLSFAFPVGDARIIDWQSVVVAVLAGTIAAFVGVLWPLRDVFRTDRQRRAPQSSWTAARLIAGIVSLAATTVILFLAPAASTLGSFTLVIALLCGLPFVFSAAVNAFELLQPVLNRASPDIAATTLRSPKTRVLSLAVVAIGGVAVFAVVASSGAQRNLQHGLDSSAHDIDSTADVWVSTRGETNAFATTPFTDPQAQRQLSALRGVNGVGVYRGSFLDWGSRRVWVLAPPAESSAPIPASEITSGNLALATRRLKEHGWIALSQALADENHLRVGEAFTLPSPQPETFRVAALTTNLGWPPGAIILTSQDYATAWASTDPSAYEIHTTPGVAPGTVRREAQAALGPNTGLTVQTAGERERLHYKLAAQGLSRLTQIRVLVLIAAIIAMLAALGSLISEHRKLMEDLRGQGIPKGVIWRWLLWETAILLTVGCLTGAVFGIYGQLLLSHALQTVTGFPTSLNIEPITALTTFILLTATALILIALPGYLIVRVPTAKTRTAS